MAQRRTFNMIPQPKIKKEVISDDDDEDTVSCKVCNKLFASEVALRNHVRMEHVEIYLNGDETAWTAGTAAGQTSKQENSAKITVLPKHKPLLVKLKKDDPEKLVKRKTEEMLSSMAPADLMSLTNQDVSYIIVKADPTTPASTSRKRKLPEKEQKTEARQREKEVQPITGPFECLQPSNLVADGTCHQIFFSCCEYSAHFRDEHTRRRKGLRCQVCEKPLSGGDDSSPFPCEVCGAGFFSNKDLSNHMATEHVKLKPFECSVCHKRFTQQGGVQQHMRMHTGDRPFSCTFCPKAFTQKSGLDQHLRTHTKVKPYRCVICSKTFCQSVHLRQHMRTHTQVSPFQCGICQKRFKQSSHLNYHLKNHNQLNMTDSQKTVYNKLMSMISVDGQRIDEANTTVMQTTEVVEEQEVEYEGEEEGVEEEEEGEEEGEEGEEQEEVEELEEVETAEVLMDEHEQMLAEQSIQVEGESYILGDVIGDD